MNDKLATITQLFDGKEIRSIWDAEKEDYYFSVVDVILVLTDSPNPRDYWYRLKTRMTEEEKSEVSTKCRQLKMKAQDGKFRSTDALDTKGIFRLIESVPSPKAEPFKMWLAKLGSDKIDEAFDPSKGIDQMIDFYLKKGYSLEWIEARIKAIIDRKKLTNTWKENGVTEGVEFAILTNDIYKEWSGMSAQEYKSYKGIRKENLRDNMTDLEVAITNIGELATREIAKNEKPFGLSDNRKVAKRGGGVAKRTKDFFEEETGSKVVSKSNSLNFQYTEDNKLIEK
ncbi:MAG: phage antirepressor protein [Bacilli bacterium]|nr:phage antirepressor protein [Bacilli bacterium]